MQTAPAPAPVIPRRPRRRWFLVAGFVLSLAVAPFLYSFYADWARERELQAIYRELDEEDPNWRWQDLFAQRPAPPDERNAALLFAKVDPGRNAMLMVLGTKWEAAAKDLVNHRNARLTAEQAELLQAVLKPVGEEKRRAARRFKDFPDTRFPLVVEENPLDVKLDYLNRYYQMLSMLQFDAMLLDQDGEIEQAAESSLALIHASGALRDQPVLFSQLVRLEGHVCAFATLERTLGQGELSEKTLERLQAGLEKEGSDNALHLALRGERASQHQVYLLAQAGKIDLVKALKDVRLHLGPQGPIIERFPALLLRGYPVDLRLFNEQVGASLLPLEKRVETIRKIDDRRRNSSNVWLRFMGMFTTQLGDSQQRSQAWLRCTVTALAAERYRLKHGCWPSDADELVKAKLLGEILKDPYDGQPLRWRRTETGLLIYSVGTDRVDHKGKLARTQPQPAATDLGFELWDLPWRRLPAPGEVEKAP